MSAARDEYIGLVAEAFAGDAPAGLRARVLAEAHASGRPNRTEPATPVEALAATVSDVDRLLGSLTAAEWEAGPALADLDVKQTVAHLHGADVYLGIKLGAWNGPLPADESDHAATTRPHVERSQRMTNDEVLEAWREWSGRLVEFLRQLPAERLGAPAAYNTIEGPLGAVLVARTFELWTHSEDIRRATGRPSVSPPDSVLATMTGVAAPLVAAGFAAARGAAAQTVRIVLTGDGGGTWTIPLGPDAPAAPTSVIVSDAADFCRLVANRIDPAELDCELEGDVTLGRELLATAPTLAMD
jgi:uncharacterized protein (TIGR03083 family)